MSNATKVLKICFEQVSAIRHPEYYRGDRPCVAASNVPDEHWHRTERTGDKDSVMSQYEGLQMLMYRGELIRDVCVYVAEQVEPQWREFAPDASRKAGGTDA
jgi:hypothetical protein